MHLRRPAAREWIFHRPILAAPHQQRSTAIHCSFTWLIKKDRTIVGSDDPASSSIWNVLRHNYLTLIGLNRREFWQEIACKRIGCDNNRSRHDNSPLSKDAMFVRAYGNDVTHLSARVERDAITQSGSQLTAYILEWMVCAVPRDKAAKKRRLDSKLLGNFGARPNRDLLTMLCGE